MKESLFAPLECKNCGKELNGGNNSKIFFCFSCKIAYLMDNYPETVRVKVYKKKFKLNGELIYFPFYRIEGTLSVNSDDSKKMNAYSKLKPLNAIFYPAFINLRSLYSEDLTLKYSLESQQFEEEDSLVEAKIVDVIVNPENLEKVAILYYLSYLDRAADVTGVEANFSLKEYCIALIPFENRENEYRELIFGTTLKSFLI